VFLTIIIDYQDDSHVSFIFEGYSSLLFLLSNVYNSINSSQFALLYLKTHDYGAI